MKGTFIEFLLMFADVVLLLILAKVIEIQNFLKKGKMKL